MSRHLHDDVIKWKHFPRNWPFVRGIHRSRWIPHTKASDAELWCLLWFAPNKRFSKQSLGWWFETLSPPLWRHRNVHQLPYLQHVGHPLIYLAYVGTISIDEMRDVQYFTSCKRIETFGMNFGALKSTPSGLNQIADSIVELYFRHNHIASIASMEGVKFVKLRSLFLDGSRIGHLHPEALIPPRLRILNLADNSLISLTDVTQHAWSSSLPKYEYLSINLHRNPWHCNGSLAWMQGRLFKIEDEIINARPPSKPYVRCVNKVFCHSHEARRGSTVVPTAVLQNTTIMIRSLHGLRGKLSRNSHQTYNVGFHKSKVVDNGWNMRLWDYRMILEMIMIILIMMMITMIIMMIMMITKTIIMTMLLMMMMMMTMTMMIMMMMMNIDDVYIYAYDDDNNPLYINHNAKIDCMGLSPHCTST